MGAGREGLREGVLPLVSLHQLGEARRVDCALFGQRLRQRDGLAVVVQGHQHSHVLLRTADAEVHAVDQSVQHMRHVEFAIDQLVAHASPGGFLRRDDLDAVLLVEAKHRGHHHRCAIGQRDEADAHLLFLGLVRTLRVHRALQSGNEAGCAGGSRRFDQGSAAHVGLSREREVHGVLRLTGRWKR